MDFFDVKGDVEALLAPLQAQFEPAEHPAMHPGRCARVRVAGREIGYVGELHPRWRQSWDLQQAPVLFDVYRPKPLRAGEEAAVGALAQGEKSLAVRLTLGSDVATLTEAEIEAAVQAVVEQLAARTGAKLRA